MNYCGQNILERRTRDSIRDFLLHGFSKIIATDYSIFSNRCGEYLTVKTNKGDVTVKLPLYSPSNMKVKFPNYGKLAKAGCNNHTGCTHCYAENNYLYSENKFSKDLACLLMERFFPLAYETMIDSELAWLPVGTTLRLNESGDMDTKESVDMWVRLLKNNPHIKAYYYSASTIDLSELDKVANRVKSILPDGSRNFGTYPEILEKSKEFGIRICPNSLGYNIVCGSFEGGCDWCTNHDSVLLLIHGSVDGKKTIPEEKREEIRRWNDEHSISASQSR